MQRVCSLLLLLGVVAAQDEHFIDVRQIVKGTIEAMSQLPEAAVNLPSAPSSAPSTATEQPQQNLMNLFKLPANIMKNLAMRAGYIEEPATSTYAPWIVTKHRSAEDESFKQADSNESWEELKPRKKKNHHRHEDDGLVALADLLPKFPTSPPAANPALPMADPMIGSAPNQPMLSQLPLGPSDTQDQTTNNNLPKYAYKAVVKDGQTYYIPVLLSETEAAPSPPSPSTMAPLPPLQMQFSLPPPPQPLLPQMDPIPNQRPPVQAPLQDAFLAPTFPPMVNPFMMRGVTEGAAVGEASKAYPPRYIRPSPTVVHPTTTGAPKISAVDEVAAAEAQVKAANEKLAMADVQDTPAGTVYEEEARPTPSHTDTKESPLRIRSLGEKRYITDETQAVREGDLRTATERQTEDEEEEEITVAPPKKHKKSKKEGKKEHKALRKIVVSLEDSSSSDSSKSIEIEMTSTTVHPKGPRAEPASEKFVAALDDLNTETEVSPMSRPPTRLRLGESLMGPQRSHRVHASKTMRIHRRLIPIQTENKTQDSVSSKKPQDDEPDTSSALLSKELEQFEEPREDTPERVPEKERTEKKTEKKRRHRTKKTKKILVAPAEEEEMTTTTTEATTTTFEEPEEIVEEEVTTTAAPEKKKKRKRKSKKTMRVPDDESVRDAESEIQVEVEKDVKPRKHKKSRRKITTTTEAPSLSSEEVEGVEPLKNQCMNIRSFARQFGMMDVEQFASVHCEYIENYYSDLTCARVTDYMTKCQEYYRS